MRKIFHYSYKCFLLKLLIRLCLAKLEFSQMIFVIVRNFLYNGYNIVLAFNLWLIDYFAVTLQTYWVVHYRVFFVVDGSPYALL